MKTRIAFASRLATILLLCVVLTLCKEDIKVEQTKQKSLDKSMSSYLRNPSPAEIGKLPEATVQLKQYPEILKLKEAAIPSSLTPASFESSLRAGGSVIETKTATVTSTPPKCDILFMMDLTGSMGGELSNAKMNSTNIMNSIASVVGDAAFGVVSHMDYPASYTSCGYTFDYGLSGFDYPYMLNQSITSDKTNITSALNLLNLGNGADYPESYTRVLYETTADASIGWRTGAKKIVIAWLDAPPHDFDLGTGTDPGRDGTAGTSDDLAMANVLAAMAAKNITLIVLNSQDYDPSNQTLWQGYAQSTSGEAFQINADGTIPDGTNIEDFIKGIIMGETGTIDKLSLEVCTPGFESWLSNVNPTSYTNLNLTSTFTGNFDATFTVPVGTPDGVYEFDVCLIGDGAEYGRQHVKLTVANALAVPFDIKPAGCPNPINRYELGILPTAILGFSGLNVADIDPTSLKLEGIAPIRWAFADVAAPYFPISDKALNQNSCNITGSDGFIDLTLKFDNTKFKSLLAAYKKNDVVKLHITGSLKNGTPIFGEDIIVIVK